MLGLKALEADRTRIKAAADATFTRLNTAKSEADKEAWETAVLWAKNAYAILSDASKKAAYDRKLANDTATEKPATDPLAGLLPGSGQQPAVHSTHPPPLHSDPLQRALPAGTVAAGPPFPAAGFPAPADPIQVPVVKGHSPVKRRRGLPWVPIFLSLFSLLTILGLGAVIYVVQTSPTIVLNTSGGPLIGSAIDPNGDGRAVAPPMDLSDNDRRAFDPVMGGLGGDMQPPQRPEITDSPGDLPPQVEVPEDPAPSTATPEMPATNTLSGEPAIDAPVAEMTAAPPEPTAEQIQAADAALAALSTAIKTYRWDQLQPLAEAATDAAVSQPQKELATSLFQLVDLAVYYRGGIEKALGTLQAGNELDLRDDLKIVIVETGPDKLIIRFNGKNKEYTFDSLPLLLAHKLARLSMPGDSPTTQAAMYSFQAIAPITTPPYREAAITELEKIDGEVEGAEPAKLVAAIRHLYEL